MPKLLEVIGRGCGGQVLELSANAQLRPATLFPAANKRSADLLVVTFQMFNGWLLHNAQVRSGSAHAGEGCASAATCAP